MAQRKVQQSAKTGKIPRAVAKKVVQKRKRATAAAAAPADPDSSESGEPDIKELLADVCRGLTKLQGRGLNRKGVIVLLHDATKQPKRNIEYVLNALEDLERTYCA